MFRLKKYFSLLLLLCLPAFAPALAEPIAAGTNYFVTVTGSDTNSGLAREKAFRTVQRGVDALGAGDILTIGPGEYLESVSRANLGRSNATTLIRAEIPGTAIIHGDVPAPPFRKVEGYRFIYAADFKSDREAQAVNEIDKLAIYKRAPNLAELEFTPGEFFHDRAANKLYVSTADMEPAGARFYTVSLSTNSGLELKKPTGVRIEGLAATGFKGRGILLDEPDNCVISDCRAWFNLQGGIFISERYYRGVTGGNLIEKCTAWANAGMGLMVNEPRRDTMRNSTSFLNESLGMEMYNGNSSRMEDCLSWGNVQDFLLKQGPRDSIHEIERCAMPGLWGHETHSNIVMHSIAGRINGNAGRSFFTNSIILNDIKSLDPDAEFADPLNRDYRLQAASRFRGAAAGGKDLGPFQYKNNIFYLSAAGDDNTDGLSISNAWKTLSRASRDLRPGDTLYIAPGRHDGNLQLKAGKVKAPAVFIRGRGTGTVELAGSVEVKDCHNIYLERLRFSGPVMASGGSGLGFEQCAFSGPGAALAARGVEGLRLVHDEFSGAGKEQINLAECKNVFLAGNLFENDAGAAVAADDPHSFLFADHNCYRRADAAWRLDGKIIPLNKLPSGMERYGTGLKSGEKAFVARGLHGWPAGNYLMNAGENARVAGPFIHAVSATSADIEWFASRAVARKEWDQPNAKVEIAWGNAPECTNKATVDTDHFGSFSLTGLEPSTKYYFKITSVKPASSLREMTGIEWNRDALVFTTAKRDPPPATYYVSTAGDDKNTGLSADRALRTLNRASALARPGDTVRIGDGTYYERLYIRSTGTKERPITFAAAPGERVELNGDRKALNCLLLSFYKSHLRFDGLHFLSISSVTPWDGGVIRLFGGEDIRLTRIFFDGRPGYSPTFLYAKGVRDLIVRNCVSIHSGGFSPRIMGCPDFRMENSLNIHNLNGGVYLDKPREGRLMLRNNIFTDCQDNKIHVGIGPLASTDRMLLTNNAWFLRPNRQYQGDEGMVTGCVKMADFRVMVERDGGLLGDPKFAVLYRNGFDPTSGIGKDFTIEHLIGRSSAYTNMTFSDFFATDPEFIRRGIGLNPDDFSDFYNKPAVKTE
jgi:hypothetical protein